DFIESPSGKRYHGEFFMYLFEDLRQAHPGLGQFKIIQTAPSQLSVQLVSTGDMSALESAIRSGFERRLPGFDVNIEARAEITRQPSGKMRVVENQLAARRGR